MALLFMKVFCSSNFDDFTSMNIGNAFLMHQHLQTCHLQRPPPDICDIPVQFSLVDLKQTRRFPFRKETNTNIELFRENLLEEWTNDLNEHNVNNAYKHFNRKLQYYYDKNMPPVRGKRSSNISRITKGIM